MHYPHSDFERDALNLAAQRAVNGLGKESYLLDEASLEMRAEKGVTLSGPELAYVRKDIFDKINDLRNKISILEHHRYDTQLRNERNDEEELKNLRAELKFLQENFAEKLFSKDTETLH